MWQHPQEAAVASTKKKRMGVKNARLPKENRQTTHDSNSTTSELTEVAVPGSEEQYGRAYDQGTSGRSLTNSGFDQGDAAAYDHSMHQPTPQPSPYDQGESGSYEQNLRKVTPSPRPSNNSYEQGDSTSYDHGMHQPAPQHASGNSYEQGELVPYDSSHHAVTTTIETVTLPFDQGEATQYDHSVRQPSPQLTSASSYEQSDVVPYDPSLHQVTTTEPVALSYEQGLAPTAQRSAEQGCGQPDCPSAFCQGKRRAWLEERRKRGLDEERCRPCQEDRVPQGNSVSAGVSAAGMERTDGTAMVNAHSQTIIEQHVYSTPPLTQISYTPSPTFSTVPAPPPPPVPETQNSLMETPLRTQSASSMMLDNGRSRDAPGAMRGHRMEGRTGEKGGSKMDAPAKDVYNNAYARHNALSQKGGGGKGYHSRPPLSLDNFLGDRERRLTIRYAGSTQEPSDNLYLAGLPTHIEQNELQSIFENDGFTVQRLRILPDTKGSGICTAMVQLASKDLAALAINKYSGRHL